MAISWYCVHFCTFFQEIATPYGLAMTVVDDGWSLWFDWAIFQSGPQCRPSYGIIKHDTNYLHIFHKMLLHFLCKCGIITLLALSEPEC